MRIRPEWDDYFLEMALIVAKRATCLRRCYGSVITNNNIIIGTGYCGAPRGMTNCTTIGTCKRQELNIPSGERYEFCRSVHSEANAIMNSEPERRKGGTIYIAGFDSVSGNLATAKPCIMCARTIKNSGIYLVIFWDADKNIHSLTSDALLQSFTELQ